MSEFLTNQMLNLSLEPTLTNKSDKDNINCDTIYQLIDEFLFWFKYEYKMIIDIEVIKIIKYQYYQIAKQDENKYLIIIYSYQLLSAIILYILKQYYPYCFTNNFDDVILDYFIEKSKFQDKNRFRIVTENLICQFLTSKIHSHDLAILDASFQNMTI